MSFPNYRNLEIFIFLWSSTTAQNFLTVLKPIYDSMFPDLVIVFAMSRLCHESVVSIKEEATLHKITS